MYNRYIVAEQETRAEQATYSPPQQPPPTPPPQPNPPPPRNPSSSLFSSFLPQLFGAVKSGAGGEDKRKPGLLSGILNYFNLGDIDTGDILLLLILAVLFLEGEDEEMLIALGLLLIL